MFTAKNKSAAQLDTATPPGRVVPFFQPKLTINQPGDVYEQEADAMADRVMRMRDNTSGSPFFKPSVSSIQRKCKHCEEEEKLQRKETGNAVNPDHSLDSYIGNLSGGQSLSKQERSFFEPKFGSDFSQVKIHTDNSAAKSAGSINALAYTSGSNIVFNSGQFAPGTDNGKRLLAHELTHVVQQGGFIQRKADKDDDCNYNKDEVEKSHSSAGHLANDVIELGDGRILISDFGVDWRHVNPSVASDAVFLKWDAIFEKDDSYQIRIVGYSDCVGSEKNSSVLRQARAKNIKNMLRPETKRRITFSGMAGLGEYVFPNNSIIERAMNRGVIIEFSRSINIEEPEVIESDLQYCGPDSTQWLIDEMNTNGNDPFIKKCGSVYYQKLIPGWGYGIMAACGKGFKELVQSGAEWDFKSNQKQWRHQAERVCPSKGCDRTVTLCNQCVNYDVPGNIHYGWVGAKAGFSTTALHLGGDFAQKGWVDDPMDVAAMDIGIRMFEKGTTLCDEISKNLTKLNRKGTSKCNPCQWGTSSRKNRKI